MSVKVKCLENGERYVKIVYNKNRRAGAAEQLSCKQLFYISANKKNNELKSERLRAMCLYRIAATVCGAS